MSQAEAHAQSPEPAMDHDHDSPDRDEPAQGGPSGATPDPKRPGLIAMVLSLASKIPLPSLGSERHEMILDATTPDPQPAAREGRARPGPSRVAGRFLFLPAKRETRVGIAALISFVVLVGALLFRKGEKGETGKQPMTLALGKPVVGDSDPHVPDVKKPEDKPEVPKPQPGKSAGKAGKDDKPSKKEEEPRTGPGPSDGTRTPNPVQVVPPGHEPPLGVDRSPVESAALPQPTPPVQLPAGPGETSTTSPDPGDSAPKLPDPPPALPDPDKLPEPSAPTSSEPPAQAPVSAPAAAHELPSPPSAPELPPPPDAVAKPKEPQVNPAPTTDPHPTAETPAMIPPVETTSAPPAAAEASPPPIPSPSLEPTPTPVASAAPAPVETPPTSVQAPVATAAPAPVEKPVSPAPSPPPVSVPVASTAPVPAEQQPLKLETVPAGSIEPAAAKTSTAGALGAGWLVIPSGGRRIVGSVPIVSTPAEAQVDAQRVADGPRVLDDPAEADQVEPVVHVVQPGENFWTISRLYYRSGRFYKALHAANRKQVPDIRQLWVGTVLRIPPPEALNRSLIDPPSGSIADEPTTSTVSRTSNPRRPVPASPEEVDLAIPTRPRVVRPDPEAVEAPPRRPTYKVKSSHETLRSIARDTLDDSRRFREIYNLNRDVLEDINVPLTAGTTLTLPEDATVGRRASK